MGKVLCFFVVIMMTFSGYHVKADIDMSKISLNDLQNQLPAEFANPNETLNNARTLFRDKCINVIGKENGTAAYNDIEMGIMSLGECLTTIVNFTAIQAEIEEASPRGELDVVFNKYCNKRPEAVQCIEDFNAKLVPCLDKDERENQEVFMRIVRSLLSFVCHKGGDQIALFIAEKGPECLESKKEDIQECINSTFSKYIPKEGIEDIKTLPKLVMGPKQCEDFQRLETCIVERLEKCSEITPANIVESMFRFIKNETICRTSPAYARQESGANMSIHGGLQLTYFILATAVFLGFNKIMQ